MASPSPADECGFTADRWRSIRKLRLAELAARQFGRARVDQIRRLGISHSTIRRWRDSGYLHQELPRVYAVGHPGRSQESDLVAAVLYAGPGAMLSHGTAAWWLGLLKYPPREIIVSTPRDIRCHGEVRVHGRRQLNRVWHNHLPVTTPSQAIVDFAATGPSRLLRLVLANADFQGMLEIGELLGLTGQGIAGTVALKAALKIHMPELAQARGVSEIILLEFCERQRLPIPRLNVYLEGWLVDAFWPDHRLVVEIDDNRGHRSPAQLQRDHQRDLDLRAAGYIVLRYTVGQLIETPGAVAADIRRYL
jgi:very-short-patch-repair endonuclease